MGNNFNQNQIKNLCQTFFTMKSLILAQDER